MMDEMGKIKRREVEKGEEEEEEEEGRRKRSHSRIVRIGRSGRRVPCPSLITIGFLFCLFYSFLFLV